MSTNADKCCFSQWYFIYG